ncbi:MAG: hypothetical protein KR126chlam1_01331 [Chlamydiae bacterium]|nr:hypothetical protein [Chlamydiota bacterium]
MKRPFSLLEVAIGLTLTAILLSTLFSCFRQIVQSNGKLEKAHSEMHWRIISQLRIKQVFENLDATEGTALFFTGKHQDFHGDVLQFTFDNGADPDPHFCCEIEAVLVRDLDDNFCLVTYSDEGEKRKEIFQSNIEKFSITFFDPETKKWTSEWSKALLPPILKIVANEESFYFSLPHSQRIAVYS